jgi:hypothetical protein
MLVEILLDSAYISLDPLYLSFQIPINTHSPQVMAVLHDTETVAADNVIVVEPLAGRRASKTRIRSGVKRIGDLIDPEHHLTKFEIERLLSQNIGGA